MFIACKASATSMIVMLICILIVCALTVSLVGKKRGRGRWANNADAREGEEIPSASAIVAPADDSNSTGISTTSASSSLHLDDDSGAVGRGRWGKVRKVAKLAEGGDDSNTSSAVVPASSTTPPLTAPAPPPTSPVSIPPAVDPSLSRSPSADDAVNMNDLSRGYICQFNWNHYHTPKSFSPSSRPAATEFVASVPSLFCKVLTVIQHAEKESKQRV